MSTPEGGGFRAVHLVKPMERAWLAGIIDARGSVGTNRHLRIVIGKRMGGILAILKQSDLGGFPLKGHSPTLQFIVYGSKRYTIRPYMKQRFYEFGVKQNLELIDDLEP